MKECRVFSLNVLMNVFKPPTQKVISGHQLQKELGLVRSVKLFFFIILIQVVKIDELR